MSQAHQSCIKCGAQIEAGQSFCPSCGNPISQVDPTVAASSPSYSPPTQQANEPGSIPYPTTYASPPVSDSPYTSSFSTPPPPTPGFQSGFYQMGPTTSPTTSPANPYNVVPPPPNEPYPAPNMGIPQAPYFPPPQQKRQLSPVMIAIVIIVVLAIGGGIIWSATRGNSPTTTTNTNGTPITGTDKTNNGNFAKEVELNLVVEYAGDKITFTKIEQAPEFEDDEWSQFSTEETNWVRLHMNETSDAEYGSQIYYTSDMTLILPDDTAIKATSSAEFSGPESGEKRNNWVNFETKVPVDLNTLTLRLGGSDKVQMEFPLKNDADLSKYEPKTLTPAESEFQYAQLDWTIDSVTQSYSADGAQADKGNVFIVVEVTANPTFSDGYVMLGYNFLRLQSGETIKDPELGSELSDYGFLDESDSNVKGLAIFMVPESEDGTYTLIFPKGDNFSEKKIKLSLK